MSRLARVAVTVAIAGIAVMSGAGGAFAQTSPTRDEAPAVTAVGQEMPAEVRESLPQGRLIGQGLLTVWGFRIYNARLWAPAGFGPTGYLRAPLALELSYLRAFTAGEVAERSIQEIRRSTTVTDAQAARWTADLLRVLPNVQKGDRIVGVHVPGAGASFWLNGKSTGQVQDAEFARLFFGIWLAPNTSEPKLRQALLAGAAG
jgi:hypothetical protein